MWRFHWQVRLAGGAQVLHGGVPDAVSSAGAAGWHRTQRNPKARSRTLSASRSRWTGGASQLPGAARGQWVSAGGGNGWRRRRVKLLITHGSAHREGEPGPAGEMVASRADLGQALLWHLLGCVAGRSTPGNSLPVRDMVGCSSLQDPATIRGVVGRVAPDNRLPVCCIVGRIALVKCIPVCRTVGRFALRDLLPIHYHVHRPVALSTAVALLSAAGFKGFPAMKAKPDHLRPPFVGSKAWNPKTTTARIHNGMTAIPITGPSIGAAWRACQLFVGAFKASR